MKDVKTEVIDTTERIGRLVDYLVSCHAQSNVRSPIMYIDLEGVRLSREGTVSILTLLLDTNNSTKHVYLIDVYTLGAQAFKSAGAKGKTLKDILQDANIPKVFFDVRNDSDALFAHFGVALQGIQDVQLMESATRQTTSSRKYLNGLAKCIGTNAMISMSYDEKARWKLAKEEGERLFKTKHSGSYDVFNKRPMPKDIVSYCVGDVQYLPELRAMFLVGKPMLWRNLVIDEAKKRVEESQKPDYKPHGPSKALAPWSKEQNTLLDQWNYVPRPRYSTFSFGLDDEDEDAYGDGYDDDWLDGYSMGCRDIINSCDYDLYYSD